MPTVGWIVETSVDRYYERGTDVGGPVVPRTYSCRQCGKVFDTLAERDSHEIEHPVVNPVMCIDGREVTSSVFHLTKSVNPEQIQFAFVDGIYLNNEPLSSPEELGMAISGATKQFFNIELRGGELRKLLKIDVLIASGEQLASVDEKFLHWFSRDDFDGNTINRFVEDTQAYNECLLYRDGLVKYLQGVMAKDQRAELLDFEQFFNRFNQAQQLLSGYDTVLARSLCDLIKFSLNDFSSESHLSHVPALHAAQTFFVGGGVDRSHWESSVQNKLPTDHVTERLLNDFIWHYDEYTFETLEEAVSQVKNRALPLQDRQKLSYLCYRKASDEGKYQGQLKYARKLNYDDVFDVELPDLETD